MPQRKLTIPASLTIVLAKPLFGETATPPPEAPIVTFRFFLEQLFTNPLWNESYKAALAQKAIHEALERAEKAESKEMELAEEDWELLKKCVETPRSVGFDGTHPGFGILPQYARQLVVMSQAIMDATRV